MTTTRRKRTDAELRAAVRKNNQRIRRASRKNALARKQIKRRQLRMAQWRAWRASEQATLKRRAERHDKPAIAARFLLEHAGWHEDAGRQNRAAWLDSWSREIGDWMVGQPWCGLAIWKAAQAAGITLDKQTVSTVYIRSAAQQGVGGFKAWHQASATPEIGWVAIYGTSGPVHTGMYVGNGRIAEGNTSPGNTGSQNNGGGLYVRTLAERRGWLLGWAEIDWSKA